MPCLRILHGLGSRGRGGYRASDSPLLTDDLAVRYRAKSLGLTPVGSLGIVVRAYHLDAISREAAVSKIQALQDISSLFVTPAIVALAIGQLN